MPMRPAGLKQRRRGRQVRKSVATRAARKPFARFQGPIAQAIRKRFASRAPVRGRASVRPTGARRTRSSIRKPNLAGGGGFTGGGGL